LLHHQFAHAALGANADFRRVELELPVLGLLRVGAQHPGLVPNLAHSIGRPRLGERATRRGVDDQAVRHRLSPP
jgi:hypothetical protein